jgi:hypothetical protein
MRVSSWEQYDLEPIRIVLLAAATGCAGGSALYFTAFNVLGGSAAELALVIALVLSYFVLSFPKRVLDSASLAQSREAPLLAAMGSAVAEATHSKARTMLFLRSGEPTIGSALATIRRKVLLGVAPDSALQQVEGRIASYSSRAVLGRLATRPAEVLEGGEESQGIAHSSQLGEESKLPVFTAVAFFTPIMLVLLIVFAHVHDPASLGELVGLEMALLDVGLYFSSAEGRMLQ